MEQMSATRVVETIPDDEKQLASVLRSFCDRFGVETKESLFESGNILLKMGKLYSEKAAKCHEAMLQKLTYIRASALMNGAKVRFQLRKSAEMAAKVDTDLSGLYSSVVISAGLPEHRSGALEETVSKLKRKLKRLREKGELEIEEIPVIQEANQGDGKLKRREREKIEKVRALNEFNTQEYKKMMTFVSERIIEILGPTPCKFAIAGLGSLAREEITLYSDFEHVIILEDEIEELSEEEKLNIREYFRWFAVNFQIIIIGLGETFIRSVGVKSINDLSSGDKSKNWFFDYFTPCGMAFDGMVPHSCNTPLGRQEPTEMKKHSVELIQPASKMAAFLRKEEALKNGYYLDDVLKNTCLVCGFEEVYKKFCKTRDKILDCEISDDIVQKERQRITGNVNNVLNATLVSIDPLTLQDVKTALYRPITVLVSCYGRVNDVREAATFEIVSSLRKKKIWTEDFCHRVEYAVAVACEARLKSYMEAGQERNNATVPHWETSVGKHGIVECNCVIGELKLQFPKLNPDYNASLLRLTYLAAAGRFRDVVEGGTKIMEKLQQYRVGGSSVVLDDSMRGRWWAMYLNCANEMQRGYTNLGLDEKDTERQQEYFSKAVNICNEILAHVEPVPLDQMHDTRHIVTVPIARMDCYNNLAIVYRDQGRFRESSEFIKKWFEINRLSNKWLQAGLISMDPHMSRFKAYMVRYSDLENRKKFMDKMELLEYLKSELKNEAEPITKLLLRCNIAIQRIAIGKVKSGREDLLSVLQSITGLKNPSDKRCIPTLLCMIGREQKKHVTWQFDLSVTVVEVHRLTKHNAIASSSVNMLYEKSMEDLKEDYKWVHEWRKAWNIPLDNAELNYLKDYKKYSPSAMEEISQEAGLLDYINDLEVQRLIAVKPAEGLRRMESQVRKGLSEYIQKMQITGTSPDFRHLMEQFTVYLPNNNTKNQSELRSTYTAFKLRMLQEMAGLLLEEGNYKEAAKIFWRGINLSKDDVKEKSVHMLLGIVSSKLK